MAPDCLLAPAGDSPARSVPAQPSFKPYLHYAPEEFRQYTQLLWMAGVRSLFTAQSFAAGLASISGSKAGAALEDGELTAALRLAEHLANALHQVCHCATTMIVLGVNYSDDTP